MKSERETAMYWVSSTFDNISGSGISLIKREYVAKHFEFGYRSGGVDDIIEISWDEIIEQIKEWGKLGWLKIIRDPRLCEDDEPCVKMLTFMGGSIS